MILVLVLAISCTPPERSPTGAARSTPVATVGVGQMAPEITGKDLDDTAFKLSDYRGKVVMLDFWGDW